MRAQVAKHVIAVAGGAVLLARFRRRVAELRAGVAAPVAGSPRAAGT